MSYRYLPANNILDSYKRKISGMHGGRVNSTLLDNILVEAYGSKMRVHELATITVPEPAQLLISPFDKGLIPAISKAISNSNLGVNPVDDGAGVRLQFPPMTEENRQNRVKELHKLMEEARIELRKHRQDLLKSEKTKKENSLISEDEYNRFEKDLQAEVDKLNLEIESVTKSKEEDLLKI